MLKYMKSLKGGGQDQPLPLATDMVRRSGTVGLNSPTLNNKRKLNIKINKKQMRINEAFSRTRENIGEIKDYHLTPGVNIFSKKVKLSQNDDKKAYKEGRTVGSSVKVQILKHKYPNAKYGTDEEGTVAASLFDHSGCK